MNQFLHVTQRTRSALHLLAVAIFGLPVLIGCAQKNEPRIVDLDPYVGGRPAPIKPVDPPAQRAAPPVRTASQDRGWTPPGGIKRRWECIVVHHSGSDKSTPQGMRDHHVRVRGWDELGYHFVIGNGIGYGDGQVFVGARWTQQKHGAHCKTDNNYYNDHGIGICLIGNLENHPPTQKQIAALARLSSFLTANCGIPQSRIYTHGGVTKKTACPGRHFSITPVLRQMSQQSASADINLDFEADVGEP